MKKAIFIFFILFPILLVGCGIDNYSHKDVYQVEVQYPQEVVQGETFYINVRSTNISGKILRNQVCTSTYKLGATISVYTIIEEEYFYLQDEFEVVTSDVKQERILKNEVLSHSWHFDGTLNSAKHGYETEDEFGSPIRKEAPKGIYNISISTGEIIENAFEIT